MPRDKPAIGEKAVRAIPADSFARMVAFAIGKPQDVGIKAILFHPIAQDIQAGRSWQAGAAS